MSHSSDTFRFAVNLRGRLRWRLGADRTFPHWVLNAEAFMHPQRGIPRVGGRTSDLLLHTLIERIIQLGKPPHPTPPAQASRY
ncbi:hypothetical protein [Rhodococcus sp. OK302]|uniref:hypothetical protein n=1 Tax=Rhodococcus sp. OK302 TaxID=1882769 RepID=UPI0011403422|nr:hypothetical protein [Rhodococcus sp. OK302]